MTCILLFSLLLSGCQPAEHITILRGPTMGTTFSVKIAVPLNEAQKQVASAGINEALETTQALMSTYRDDSELSRFNRSAVGAWFDISAETEEVLRLSEQISSLSGGAFDVTVGPLVNLWGFGPEDGPDAVPDAARIAEVQAGIGYQHLDLAPGQIRKNVSVYVDLSAIAKGYAVDLIERSLQAQGLNSYLIEVGGELKGVGRKPDGQPWRIAIESPVSAARTVHRVLRLDGMAIATSGDYRNYFEKEGQRFSHTIDPATGRPITHKLASVTVLDPMAARADALATAIMVMGPEAGYALAEELGVAVFIIVKDGDGFTERYTPQMANHLEQAT